MARALTSVDHRTLCAYWYAVGHADASGEPDLAEAFRAFVRSEAEAYERGDVSSLSSIPDQWQRFSKAVSV